MDSNHIMKLIGEIDVRVAKLDRSDKQTKSMLEILLKSTDITDLANSLADEMNDRSEDE